MNQVEINFIDKSNRMAALTVNNKTISIHFVTVQNGFDVKTEYMSRLANDWNMSNPIEFQAKTIKGLVGKIKRHKHRLVKCQ